MDRPERPHSARKSLSKTSGGLIFGDKKTSLSKQASQTHLEGEKKRLPPKAPKTANGKKVVAIKLHTDFENIDLN